MIILFSSNSSSRNNSIFTLLMRIAHNQWSAWVKKMGPARADMGWWDAEKLASKICISPHPLVPPPARTPGSTPPRSPVMQPKCGAEGSLRGSGQPGMNTTAGRKGCHLFSGQNHPHFKQLLKIVENQPCFLSQVSRTSLNTHRNRQVLLKIVTNAEAAKLLFVVVVGIQKGQFAVNKY